MITKNNDIIRRQFTVSQAYLNCRNEYAIEGKIKWAKKSAISLATKLGWKDWDIEEMYGPNHRWIDVPTPYVGPKTWRESVARFGHCVYQVVLYKK